MFADRQLRDARGLGPGAGVLVLTTLLFAGCASQPTPPPHAPVEIPARPEPEPAPLPANPLGERIVTLAEQQIGVPYRYGGATPQGFDCSGLVYYLFSEVGLRVPRTAEQQMNAATRVPRESLLPGDLVFFWLPQAHVGIYAGNGEFIHAPTSGRGVERTRLDQPFFILGFAGGGRFPP